MYLEFGPFIWPPSFAYDLTRLTHLESLAIQRTFEGVEFEWCQEHTLFRYQKLDLHSEEHIDQLHCGLLWHFHSYGQKQPNSSLTHPDRTSIINICEESPKQNLKSHTIIHASASMTFYRLECCTRASHPWLPGNYRDFSGREPEASDLEVLIFIPAASQLAEKHSSVRLRSSSDGIKRTASRNNKDFTSAPFHTGHLLGAF